MIEAPVVKELTDEEQALLRRMWARVTVKRQKNLLLDVYYDGHRTFKDLGISIPPQMQATRAALGWPQKAVSALARKHVFEGYSVNGELDPFEVGGLLARNAFETELPQAITSAYKHGVAFLTVAMGDVARGEPEVMIQARDAAWTTAVWDERTRTLTAALAIDASTKEGRSDQKEEVSGATVFFRDSTVLLERSGRAWSSVRVPNASGRVMVEPLVYDPQLRRPFGRSRISREVRYLTDAAIRALVRTETSAEFFASPQRYALGAPEGAFEDMDKWSAITGRLLALSVNDEGQVPQLGQFPQMSMEPHLSMYRQLAQNFCAATNLPMSAVGLFGENPASAEAMQAAEYALSEEAEYQWRVFTPALRRLVQDVVMLRDGKPEPPAESWGMSVNWTPARYVAPQVSADFIAKIASAMPDAVTTTVGMRRAGFTQAEVEQIRAETAPGKAVSVLDRLAAVSGTTPASDGGQAPPRNGRPVTAPVT